MKILLFGKNGQVGWELQRSLAPLGELVALDSDSGELCGDFTDLEGVAKTVRAVAPDVIVNAAAYTAVDKAEDEQDLVQTINALAPGVLAREGAQINASLIHYSTDYVFDGSGNQAWIETDRAAPLNFYGSSKLEGEQLIQQSGCKHLIFRTSWVYGARGQNFAKSILRLAQERDSLKVVCDQMGTPTGAELIADITAQALAKLRRHSEVSGLYHLVAAGETSWHGYASFVLEAAESLGIELKVTSRIVERVATESYPTRAKRPRNSRMNTNKLQNTFDLHLPPWEKGVKRMLAEILDKHCE